MSMAEGGYGEPPVEDRPNVEEAPWSPAETASAEAGGSPLDEAVARAIAGDGLAFDEIYRLLSGPVYSYLTSQVRRREDAEDLTGQVFLEAMRGVRQFSGDGSAFRGWL